MSTKFAAAGVNHGASGHARSVSDRAVTTTASAADAPLGGSLGVAVVSVFLFVSYSRVADLFLVGLRIPLVMSLIALAIAIGSGGVARAFTSRIGIWLSAYSAWIVLTIPFSFWRGGSVQLLMNQWIKSFVVFFIVAGLLRTARQCRIAIYALGLAAIAIVMLATWFGTTALDGRLSLESGVLSNANELALVLLLCVPGILLVYLEGSGVTRVAMFVAMIGALGVVGQTGSRGGVVTLGGMLLAAFFSFAWKTRIKLLVGVCVIAVITLPVVSPAQRARYATIFGAESDAPGEAVGSRENRIELLKDSIALTVLNPIFGVGPGVFEPAAAKYNERRGQQALWRGTHNSYTQVSSETGFPGLFFYMGTLLGSIKAVRGIYRQTKGRKEFSTLEHLSFCLWLSLLAYSIASFFGSVAYHLYLPTLAGLAVALQLAAVREVNTARETWPASAHSRSPREFSGARGSATAAASWRNVMR